MEHKFLKPIKISLILLGLWLVCFQKNSGGLDCRFKVDLDGDGSPERIFIKTKITAPVSWVKVCTKERCYSQGQIPAWRVEKVDIDGDQRLELAFGLYAYEHKDKKVANRLYFYQWDQDHLVSLWRGTALSWPFLDFCIYDWDRDGISEVLALERSPKGEPDSCRLVAYYWSGFGLAGEKIIPVDCKEWLKKKGWVRDETQEPIYPRKPILTPKNISSFLAKEEKK